MKKKFLFLVVVVIALCTSSCEFSFKRSSHKSETHDQTNMLGPSSFFHSQEEIREMEEWIKSSFPNEASIILEDPDMWNATSYSRRWERSNNGEGTKINISADLVSVEIIVNEKKETRLW